MNSLVCDNNVFKRENCLETKLINLLIKNVIRLAVDTTGLSVVVN